MMRRMLLGLVCAVVVCGAVAAKPPGLQPNPHAEGREVDPVTRDFYLPEPPRAANDDSAPARTPERSADWSAFWVILLEINEAVMNEFTMPLGTIEMGNAELGMQI